VLNLKKDLLGEIFMKIVTFNIRCVWDDDGINSFMHRVGLIYDKIRSEKPDIIAFQECTPRIMEILEKMFPEYDFYGQYRSVNYWGEGLFTAVRKEDYRIASAESFWISPTPHVPGSRFPEQSDCPRICNAVVVRNKKTDKMLRLFNIHLDHISEEARVKGMELMLGKIAEYNEHMDIPSVMLGDFNATPESESVEMCAACKTPALFDITADIEYTYHGFGGLFETAPNKIDYIFVSEELSNAFVKSEVWKDSHEGIYLSDHYPVCAEFEY
jgi:endonuclease/exonuclease/phosphatase family metal-dependent hydrolase